MRPCLQAASWSRQLAARRCWTARGSSTPWMPPWRTGTWAATWPGQRSGGLARESITAPKRVPPEPTDRPLGSTGPALYLDPDVEFWTTVVGVACAAMEMSQTPAVCVAFEAKPKRTEDRQTIIWGPLFKGLYYLRNTQVGGNMGGWEHGNRISQHFYQRKLLASRHTFLFALASFCFPSISLVFPQATPKRIPSQNSLNITQRSKVEAHKS